jgi:adenine phosphoribosyltransferase
MTQPIYDLADLIRSIPDYPIPGMTYRDITPLLRRPRAFQQAVGMLASRYACQTGRRGYRSIKR